MAADQMTITVRVRVAWWVRPYVWGVAFTAKTFGLEPDLERVGRVVLRGLTPYIER